VEDRARLERLQRLLGGPELAGLRQRLRARYERGEQSTAFTLTALSAIERRALEGLLGRATKTAPSMRLILTELDDALSRAGLAPTLRHALELLDGPVHDLKAQREILEQAWSLVLTNVAEPRLQALLATTSGAALLKRLSGSDPHTAKDLLQQAQRVLIRLPEHGIPRAQLAAQTLGDSHALDAGFPVSTLVLRAGATDSAEQGEGDEHPREQWARLGVTVNELAAPALCLNLPIQQSSLATTLAPGEPIHLTLRKLLRDPPAWAAHNQDVFVCENPNIVAIAADRLGQRCAPLVCTDGMPSAAQQTLISQLRASGARLRYHGDFDWPGLRIGNFVIRVLGATPWRFGTEDYLTACLTGGSKLGDAGRAEAQWDPRLAATMADRSCAIHEEAIAETLLLDLRAEASTR
jgi:uncharacterized protein (TIGR02679 family)